MSARQTHISHPVVAININKTYRYGINAEDLYDCTRGIWRLSKERAEKAQYAFSVYQGVIKEVYKIDRWFPAGSTTYVRRRFKPINMLERYEFVGKLASDEIREKYVGREMPVRQSQNPIRYFNF